MTMQTPKPTPIHTRTHARTHARTAPQLPSIRRQPSHDLSHLLIPIDAKTLVPRDAGQLDVLGVELLLHDLLQRLEHQRLGLGQGQGFVEFVLQLGLGAFGAGPNGFGVVAVEGA